MKKYSKILLSGLLLGTGTLTLVSCGEDGQTSLVDEVLSKIILTEENADVSADFTIPKTVTYKSNVYNISWESSDATVLSIEDTASDSAHFYTADIHQPFDEDKDITLTASATADSVTKSVEIKTTVVKTDAEKALAAVISKVVADNKLTGSFGEKTEVNLPAKSNEYKDEVTLAYSLDKTYTTTTLDGTKLTLDPTVGDEKVKLTVTATCGDKTFTKDVNINVSTAINYLTVSEALDQPKGTMMYVQGRIKSVVSDKYGNFWIEDEAGKEIEIYGLYKGAIEECYDANNAWLKKGTRYDSWEASEKLAVGDYVFVYGKRTAYKTTEEIENCLIQPYPYSTVAEALEAPKGTILTMYATVKSIDNEKYGNITLEGADGKTIPTYGLYKGDVTKHTWDEKAGFVTPDGVDAPVKYGDWKEGKLAVGDVIVIMGPKDVYKDKPQVKNPILVNVLKKAAGETPEPEPTVTEKDITASVTIADGKIRIPFNAMDIKGEGTYTITLDANTKITIKGANLSVDTSFKELMVAKNTAITVSIAGGTNKITSLTGDVYGDNTMKCYAGTDATGTELTAHDSMGQGTKHLYVTGTASSVYYVNTSTEKDAGLFSLTLTVGTEAVEAPVAKTSLTECVFNKAFGNENWSYIPAETEQVDWYSNGGLKLNKEGMGVKSATFDAKNSVEVVLFVKALNAKTKDEAKDQDAFTIKAYNAAGTVVDTKTLKDIEVAEEISVTLTGEGIVSVEVVMTHFPNDATGKNLANVNLGAVFVREA